MSPVEVREVGTDDWSAFRDTRIAALADAPWAFITTLAEARATTDDEWRRRAGKGGSFLAWRGGRPVGIAAGYVPAGGPELVAMWVAPAARGSGVVEALVDAVVSWTQALRAAELRLWVVRGNDRAQRAYERYGFVLTGREQPVPGRPDEIEIEMSYALRR